MKKRQLRLTKIKLEDLLLSLPSARTHVRRPCGRRSTLEMRLPLCATPEASFPRNALQEVV